LDLSDPKIYMELNFIGCIGCSLNGVGERIRHMSLSNGYFFKEIREH
jgi:hypothetical protein